MKQTAPRLVDAPAIRGGRSASDGLWKQRGHSPHALRERKLRPEIDRVGGATHISLPCVGAGLN